MTKSIVVVGGGTAGWMAALMAKQVYPTMKVTVIESSDIGILGAGEGTTPHFVNFLDYVGIAITDIVGDAALTFKNSIKFDNWNGDGKAYHHPFDSVGDLDPFNYQNGLLVDTVLDAGLNLDSISIASLLENTHRVPAMFKNKVLEKNENLLHNVDFLCNWGIHFDANKMAGALSRIGIQRGIERIDAEVVSCETVDGSICKLFLKNGKFKKVDFLFDCTGFARKFLGGELKATWESFSDFLPMKQAVPFFLPHDNNVDARTDAIAMKYGWVWKIPVRDRYGCGYVFDSDYITAEEALAEASEYFSVKLESPRVFKFSAGCYRETLIGNCMAAGLSQGFVEPLEATSLMTSFLSLRAMFEFGIFAERSEVAVQRFNKKIFDRNVAIADFIHMHYLTSRNDSPFWCEFKKKNKTPEDVVDLVANFESGRCLGEWQAVFPVQSWTYVLSGLGHRVKPNELFLRDNETAQLVVNNQQRMANASMSHKLLLQYLLSKEKQ
tara:strand:- start:41 stop:1528 length:1488 start_codon:yes stop_codon:yes gene_type:complete